MMSIIFAYGRAATPLTVLIMTLCCSACGWSIKRDAENTELIIKISEQAERIRYLETKMSIMSDYSEDVIDKCKDVSLINMKHEDVIRDIRNINTSINSDVDLRGLIFEVRSLQNEYSSVEDLGGQEFAKIHRCTSAINDKWGSITSVREDSFMW